MQYVRTQTQAKKDIDVNLLLMPSSVPVPDVDHIESSVFFRTQPKPSMKPSRIR